MIFFFASGRLGNQLLQYAALETYYPDQRKVFIEWTDLDRACDGLNGCFLSGERLPSWITPGRLLRWAGRLARLRLIGQIKECQDGNSFQFVQTRGLIPNVFFVRQIWMQHREVAAKLGALPQLKPAIMDEARRWLSERVPDARQRPVVFVHVRRGDYLAYPTREHPAVLSLSWYRLAMQKMRESLHDPCFVMLSDDPYYLRDVFEASDSLVISENSPAVDLAICMLCGHGILSASSFAWWAAYNIHRAALERESNCAPDHRPIFFAPVFWAGCRMRDWYPVGFKFDWIQYLEAP